MHGSSIYRTMKNKKKARNHTKLGITNSHRIPQIHSNNNATSINKYNGPEAKNKTRVHSTGIIITKARNYANHTINNNFD